MDIKQICRNIFKRKSMDDLINTSKRSELKKTLNVFDLILILIGAFLGTCIFTISCSAITVSSESAGAGPAIVV